MEFHRNNQFCKSYLSELVPNEMYLRGNFRKTEKTTYSEIPPIIHLYTARVKIIPWCTRKNILMAIMYDCDISGQGDICVAYFA